MLASEIQKLKLDVSMLSLERKKLKLWLPSVSACAEFREKEAQALTTLYTGYTADIICIHTY